jgi:ligand-binding sensor domain-containing protein/signal transduction histidine kinase
MVPSAAQENELEFTHLSTDNGVSNNTIHSLIQDHMGFIWIGTDDGLNRYDGYEFLNFKHNTRDSTSLSSNTIFRIMEDSKRRLWIAGSTGIDIFNHETMTFKRIPLSDSTGTLYYSSYTRAILEDHDHRILVANTNGIYRFDEKMKIFRSVSIDVPSYGTTQQEGIRSMHVDKHNRIWIGSVGYGLFAYDPVNKKIVVSPEKSKALNFSNRIFSIAEDEKGDIWLGTDKGIYIVRSDLSEIFPLSRLISSESTSVGDVMDIKIYDDDVWIGTDGHGLIRYNRNSGKVIRFLHDNIKTNSLGNNSVRTILRDNQGLLWVGTLYGGVNFAQLRKTKQFSLLRNETGDPNSLSYGVVCAIYQDSRSNLWIGTDGGGVDHYTADYRKLENYSYQPGSKSSINANAVLTIDEDSQGRIWIGGYGLGLNVIDPVTKRIQGFQHDPENSNSLSSDNVWDIYIDKNDIVWIATNEGGLNRYDITGDRFKHYFEGPDNTVVSNWCIKLYPDSKGELWIGTYNGFSIFNTDRETFRNYTSATKTGGPSNNWIYTFAEDSAGNMWIGTATGLNYFHRDTEKFEVFDQNQGLPNEVINGILIDSHQNLWISTNKGLAKFNPDGPVVKSYDKLNGLQGDQFIHGAYYKSKEGRMYFGGQNGLSYFFPDSIGTNNFKPPVYLTDLMLNFREVVIGAKGSPLRKSISEIETLVLTHLQSTFTIKYTALNFFNTSKNQFAYRLYPYDKDWIYVGNRREATYTNLDPGTYVLTVIASNNDGIWNEEGASLTIKILPAWWDTLLFKIIVSVLLVVLVIFLSLLRVRNLKTQKLNLEYKVERRTSEIREKNALLKEQATKLNETNVQLEERQQQIEEQAEELQVQKEELEIVNENLKELNSTKDKFFSIIAHDLKNPFGTIIGFAELLRDRFEVLENNKKKTYISAIFDAASNVYNLLENLLDWARSQTDRIQMSPAPIKVSEIIEANLQLTAEMSMGKRLSITQNIQGNLIVYADFNMIHTVVRNLLTNAIKFTTEDKNISITAQITGNMVQVAVKDEGVGISENDLKKLFRVDQNLSREGTKGESGTGLGLILCKEYITKHEGKIWAESEEGKGSVFYFTLPHYTHPESND